MRAFAGHSKWANIKHRKARRDTERQGNFAKQLKAIEAAAQIGGNDESNFTLASAITEAKKLSVPNNKINAAIERGCGDGKKSQNRLERVQYEGHAAGGVAILVDTFTDNKKRTAPNIRHYFSKFGGSLGNSGSVSWMYEEQIHLKVHIDAAPLDDVLEVALEAGASDIVEAVMGGSDDEHANEDEESHVVVCSTSTYVGVKKAMDNAGIETVAGGLHHEPNMRVDDLSEDESDAFDNLIGALVEDDDVQAVYHNRAGLPVRID